jgi:hypothetical protein
MMLLLRSPSLLLLLLLLLVVVMVLLHLLNMLRMAMTHLVVLPLPLHPRHRHRHRRNLRQCHRRQRSTTHKAGMLDLARAYTLHPGADAHSPHSATHPRRTQSAQLQDPLPLSLQHLLSLPVPLADGAREFVAFLPGEEQGGDLLYPAFLLQRIVVA